jgi:hypothetical protein
MGNISDKNCKENQNTHLMASNSPPPHKYHALCEIISKNIVEQGRPQMTIWRLRYPACKAKYTHHNMLYI